MSAHTYKLIELVGSSHTGIEAATRDEDFAAFSVSLAAGFLPRSISTTGLGLGKTHGKSCGGCNGSA